VTEVEPRLLRYAESVKVVQKRQGLLNMLFADTLEPTADDVPAPSDADALRPPSPAVRAEMIRLELELTAGQQPATPDAEAAQTPPGVDTGVEPGTDPDAAGSEERTQS
jgi:hypothetical protein